jgi:predicted dienelactone hydrolase
MERMARVSGKEFFRLLPGASLFSFIEFNAEFKDEKFFCVFLRNMKLDSFAMKVLRENEYPRSAFIIFLD